MNTSMRALRWALLSLATGVVVLGVAGPTHAAGLGDMLGALASTPGGYRGKQDLQEGLERLAGQINRTLPKDIDQDFRLERVSAEPGAQLVYHYTVLHSPSAGVSKVAFNTQVAPLVRDRLCQDTRMLRVLKSGATVGYAYRGRDGGEIGKLSFVARDCQKDG